MFGSETSEYRLCRLVEQGERPRSYVGFYRFPGLLQGHAFRLLVYADGAVSARLTTSVVVRALEVDGRQHFETGSGSRYTLMPACMGSGLALRRAWSALRKLLVASDEPTPAGWSSDAELLHRAANLWELRHSAAKSMRGLKP